MPEGLQAQVRSLFRGSECRPPPPPPARPWGGLLTPLVYKGPEGASAGAVTWAEQGAAAEHMDKGPP